MGLIGLYFLTLLSAFMSVEAFATQLKFPIEENIVQPLSLTKVSDMRLIDLEDIGPHYSTTLAAWRQNFFKKISDVRALGYSEEFIKMWEFYLCYCEGGFFERSLGDAHLLLAKPMSRRASFS